MVVASSDSISRRTSSTEAMKLESLDSRSMSSAVAIFPPNCFFLILRLDMSHLFFLLSILKGPDGFLLFGAELEEHSFESVFNASRMSERRQNQHHFIVVNERSVTQRIFEFDVEVSPFGFFYYLPHV
jgi:hypothetical protein